jgi:hypothetical protein
VAAVAYPHQTRRPPNLVAAQTRDSCKNDDKLSVIFGCVSRFPHSRDVARERCQMALPSGGDAPPFTHLHLGNKLRAAVFRAGQNSEASPFTSNQSFPGHRRASAAVPTGRSRRSSARPPRSPRSTAMRALDPTPPEYVFESGELAVEFFAQEDVEFVIGIGHSASPGLGAGPLFGPRVTALKIGRRISSAFARA